MNNNNTEHNSVIERVSARIAQGEVPMRTHTVFVLKTVLLIFLAVIIFASSSLLLNFILFSVQSNNHEALLGFGPRGWSLFFQVFPWVLFVLDIVSVVLLTILIRTFHFGYRMPVLYVLGGIFFFVILFGFTIERKTPMNVFLVHEAERRELHQSLPRFIQNSLPPGLVEQNALCHCEIVEIVDTETLRVQDLDSGEVFVAIVKDASHATTTGLSTGMRVFMAGDHEGDVFTVFGMRLMGGRHLRLRAYP